MLFFTNNGSDTVILFDFLPVPTPKSKLTRSLTEFGKLIYTLLKADIIILGTDKALPATKLNEPEFKEDLLKRLTPYKYILCSGAQTIKKLMTEKEVHSAVVLLKSEMTPVSLNVLLSNAKITAVVTTTRDKSLKISFKKSDWICNQTESVLKQVCENLGKGTVSNIEMKFTEKPVVGKAGDGIYTITEWDGKRVGFTEMPTYFQKKIYPEFFSILLRDLRFVLHAEPISDFEWHEIKGGVEEIKKVLKLENDGKRLPISLDVETTGIRPWEYYDLSNTQVDGVLGKSLYDPMNENHDKHRIISASVCTETGKAFSFLVDHPRIASDPGHDGRAILKWICELPNSKIIHNAKYEYQWIELYYGIEIRGVVVDTMITEHILNEGMFSGSGRYSLEGCIAMELCAIPHKTDYAEDTYTDHTAVKLGSKKDVREETIEELAVYADADVVSFRNRDFSLMANDDLHRYGCLDVIATLRLFLHQVEEFRKRNMQRAYSDVVKDLVWREVRSLGRMEYTGMRVDTKLVRSTITKCDEIIKTESQHLLDELGSGINFTSNAELSRVIYAKFPDLYAGLEFTEKGDIEITEGVKKKFGKQYPWLYNLFELKHAMKTRGTYMIPFLQYASAGRVHFGFNIAGPATGRLSSSNPNMQNIPKGISTLPIKTCLFPDNGKLLFNIDLSNAEVRMLANYSSDVALTNMLLENKDMHSFTASGMYNIPYEDILLASKTDESLQTSGQKELCKYRQNAKPLNFGIIYGITAAGVSRQLGCSENEAQDMINKFFETYYGVKAFLDKVEKYMRDHGFVETFIGRRRSFPIINHGGGMVPNYIIEKMCRQAKNFIIQSATSDFFQYLIWDLIQLPGLTPHITVHDSLVFSFDETKSSAKDLYDHFYKTLIVKPRELWPKLVKVDMKFDLDAGYAYGSKKNKKLTKDLIYDLHGKGMSVAEFMKTGS